MQNNRKLSLKKIIGIHRAPIDVFPYSTPEFMTRGDNVSDESNMFSFFPMAFVQIF